MKPKIFFLLVVLFTLAALTELVSVLAQNLVSPLQNEGQIALGSAFTYQGSLNENDNPATGSYDFKFELYDSVTGGSQIGNTITQSVAVNNGLFTVVLDFGADVFRGDARYLEISVRLSGSGDYTTLTPRQELTAAPYASSKRFTTGRRL